MLLRITGLQIASKWRVFLQCPYFYACKFFILYLFFLIHFYYFLCIFLSPWHRILQGIYAEDVEVTVEQGVLNGEIVTSVLGESYYSFKGIPYAKPPVGALRFKVNNFDNFLMFTLFVRYFL